jgi:hypothetical protein
LGFDLADHHAVSHYYTKALPELTSPPATEPKAAILIFDLGAAGAQTKEAGGGMWLHTRAYMYAEQFRKLVHSHSRSVPGWPAASRCPISHQGPQHTGAAALPVLIKQLLEFVGIHYTPPLHSQLP